jgi:hypothetical protein
MASDPTELTIESIVDPTTRLVEFKMGSSGDSSLSPSSAAPKPKRSCLKNKSTDPNQKYTGSDSPGYFCLFPSSFLNVPYFTCTCHTSCSQSFTIHTIALFVAIEGTSG